MSEEESTVELSDTAKALAGLVTIGTIVGISTWIALAKSKDTPLDRYMAQQSGGDGDGDGDGAQQAQPETQESASESASEKTLWDSIVEAFGPDVQISMGGGGGGGGYGDAGDV